MNSSIAAESRGQTMSAEESKRDTQHTYAGEVMSRSYSLWRASVVRWWLAVAIVLVVVATGCGIPTQSRQGASTTPSTAPGSTLYAGTYHGWVYAVSSTDGHVRWHATDASWPVLADGVLYTASGTGLAQALSPTDGHVRWHTQLFDQPNRAIAAAPVVEHGVIYVAATGVNRVPFGAVYALDAANGSVLWHFDTQGQGIIVSPVVADGSVYIAADALYALRASDGHLVRRIETGSYFTTRPTIQAGIAYITLLESPASRGSAIEAIRVADSTQLWRKHISVGTPSDPLVVGDTVYTFGGVRADATSTSGSQESGYVLLYALHASDGSVQWTFRTASDIDTPPAVDGNTLYAGSSDGYLYLIDRSKGTLLQRYRIDDGQYTNTQRYHTFWTTPSVQGGVMYFGAAIWDMMFPSHPDGRTGRMFAMRERDGAVLWEADLVGWISLLQLGAP